MNSQDTGLTIDLDKVLGAGPAPQAPVTDAIGKQVAALEDVPSGTPLVMDCRSMLDASTRAAVEAKAKELYPLLRDDDVQMGEFGNEAVAHVNTLVGKMLDDLGGAANVPELTKVTNDLDDRLRGFTRKYGDDSSIADARNAYEKSKGTIMDFVNKFRNMLHMLLKDAKGLQAYLDSLKAELIDRKGELRANVERCNVLYASNEEAIKALVVHIAIMEALQDEARAQIDAIVLDDTDPNVREKREERDRLVAWESMLEVRTGEFKQRLFVAWGTAPQIRNIRAISWGLDQRLGMLINLTIPVFELTVVQWAMALQAQDAVKTQEAVASATQDALNAWANASGQLIPQAAKAIQAPSMDPSAIVAVAQSLQEQAEGFVSAYQEGRVRRAELEATMMKAAAVIASSQDKAANAVAEIVAAGKATEDRLAIEASKPSVALPAVIMDNASKVLVTPDA